MGEMPFFGAIKARNLSDSVTSMGVRNVELNCDGGSAADAVNADTKQSRKSFAFIVSSWLIQPSGHLTRQAFDRPAGKFVQPLRYIFLALTIARV